MSAIQLPILILLAQFTLSFGQGIPQMRYQDKIRIREAFTLSKQFGDKIWKGINEVPFAIILVTDSAEFLINHPYPSNDFKLIGNDSILKTKVYQRPKQFDKRLLATFPAVNGVNCVVVGTPENTGKNSTAWTITLLHEHFHQYEYTYPDYYTSVNALNLSGGDQTGMWMLNYPFPYDSAIVMAQYKKYMAALSKTVLHLASKEFERDFKEYTTERTKFKQMLQAKDYTYFSFQIWQEGIAQYTEYKFLELLDEYKPSPEMSGLSDFVPFKKYKENFYTSQLKLLEQLSLKEDKRVCFYANGFAEGLLLDKLNPEWHDKFLTNKFYIERYSRKYE